MAFQLDLPKFNAANAQVLGVSVDFNNANKAWAKTLGISFPMLSDMRRQMAQAYGVLNDDPAMATDPKRIATYLRAKRTWFVIDKEGVVRFTKTAVAKSAVVINDEILQVLQGL